MMSLLFLVAWMSCGVIAAVTLSSPDEPRWAWTPLAAVVGPLWLSVVLDQRQEDDYARLNIEWEDGS